MQIRNRLVPVTLFVVFICSIIIQTLLFNSCSFNNAAGKVEQYEQEPEISLYIAETDEKKNIKIEQYIMGVVAAEMDTAWPVNALAAQAILARTFTLENISAGRMQEIHGTDASTDIEEFQAFDAEKINDNVKQAVEKTRGQIVSYNGRYIHAWFSADNGGITASAAEGLDYYKEKTPYIKAGIEDKGHEYTAGDNKQWTVAYPLEYVHESIKEKLGQDTGEITQAYIQEKGPSGRAVKIVIGNVEISGPSLRLALGSEQFRSTLLSEFEIVNDQLIISGSGFGHGVGMSQWGAKYLAEQGCSPEEIINFYFQDVDITNIWE